MLFGCSKDPEQKPAVGSEMQHVKPESKEPISDETAPIEAIKPVPEEKPSLPKMAVRAFGKTGLQLSVLGLGSSALVHAWSQGYGSKPGTVEERAALVRRAYDCGVRYFDTGRTYYDMEQVIGQGLKGVREDCCVATKVTVTDPAKVHASVEKSLETLGMDRVDIMQIHSSGAVENLGFEGSMKIHTELVKLRDEGLFKYIGLTTHVAFETVYKLIATGGFDQVLLAYGYIRKGMNTLLSERNLKFREQCLAKAHELKMGIVAMKVLGVSVFGRMSKSVVPDYDPEARKKLPGAAMRWVLNDKRVSLMVIGMSYPEEIEENVSLVSSDLALTREDKALLADFSKKVYESPRFKEMPVDDEKISPERRAKAVFGKYDRNRDGKLSREELPKNLLRHFDECDADKDGLVTVQELTDALRAAGGYGE